MLNFRPQGGTDLSRAVAAAYQALLTPGEEITNTATDASPHVAVGVLQAVHASRRPMTGRQLQLATGYRADPTNAQDKIREWERMKADAAQQTPAWIAPPTWLQAPQPPAWLANRRTR